ncbi:hypothetical protein QKU48_gp1035 [Fadolivirus algeromassiliense]|jgi:hypothetical protein|uniref:Uncharacterized protein n=1 Tax=Fadolivirus FV1/VV64 TaxID=3070911 RepID=A0A7D3URB3_9VIRU|nr:hypothetical protein QKU48_gp1035 [Fadolivirus algeromassiliense]QKF94493.1 hypothetical protein Fadolivirus_1_1035 [Fadolivirus FV1/VV64]
MASRKKLCTIHCSDDDDDDVIPISFGMNQNCRSYLTTAHDNIPLPLPLFGLILTDEFNGKSSKVVVENFEGFPQYEQDNAPIVQIIPACRSFLTTTQYSFDPNGQMMDHSYTELVQSLRVSGYGI